MAWAEDIHIIVTVKNITTSAVSTDAGLIQPGATANVVMSAMQMYLASPGFLSLENLGYITVSVNEETAVNLAATSPTALTGPSYPPREPKLDIQTFTGPINYTQVLNATATVGSPAQLTTDLSGAVVLNTAAGAKVGMILPPSQAGMNFSFACTSANGFQIKGSGAETIQVLAATSTATTGHIDNATLGNSVELVCHTAGKWFALNLNGTWTVT